MSLAILDRLTSILRGDTHPGADQQPDEIEQWHAELRALPTAAELDTPAVNTVNEGGEQ
ncbi:hypothetical protein [Micromonospora sp. URMC 103]|uniref:hypothetical protein n=1 Tax=Micromonospora sp. URMC 103 TaxID=3423406 RepID=UPI003F1D5BD5